MKTQEYLALIALILLSTANTAISKKFATHALIVLTDSTEKSRKPGAMMDEVACAFKSYKPFILPGRFLYQFMVITRSTEKAESDFENQLQNFEYFKLPHGPKDNVQYYLCYPVRLANGPEEHITELAINNPILTQKIYIPTTITTREKNSGLLVSHFEQVKLETIYSVGKSTLDVLTFRNTIGNEIWIDNNTIRSSPPPIEYLTDTRLAQSLRYVLDRLFVSNSSYINQDPPAWAIIFSGHGGQYIPQEKDVLIKDYQAGNDIKFLKQQGSISCLDVNVFSQIISTLSEIITIRLIDIATCYGGGINLGDLLRQSEQGVIPPYRFIIGSHTVVGDATTLGFDLTNYDKFFNELFTLDFTEPSIDWEQIMKDVYDKPSTLSIEERQNKYKKKLEKAYDSINIAYEPVYKVLPSIYTYVIGGLSDGTVDANNIPAYKPVESNYFVEIPFSWLMRLGKKDAEFFKNGTKDISRDINYLLLYTSTVPYTLRLEGSKKIPAFLSTIPGDTFHIINKIERKNSNQIDAMSLLEAFCKIEDLEANKIFYIKEADISLIKNSVRLVQGPAKIMIKRHYNSKNDEQEVYAIFFSKTRDEYGEVKGKWNDKKSKFNFTKNKLDKNVAAKEIAMFRDEIKWLKQLAIIQAPYRFLKDADIETLPWKELFIQATTEEIKTATTIKAFNTAFVKIKEKLKSIDESTASNKETEAESVKQLFIELFKKTVLATQWLKDMEIKAPADLRDFINHKDFEEYFGSATFSEGIKYLEDVKKKDAEETAHLLKNLAHSLQAIATSLTL